MPAILDDEERDVRVGDYLDDKLQTLTDLDSLDALLSSVRNQHVLLKKQLQDAEQDQDEARKAAEERTTSLRQRATQFERQQKDIDRRLQIITQSDTSSDGVRRFEASMDRLRRLDVADGYIQQMQTVDSLSQDCLLSLGKDDARALDAYSRLHDLSSKLPALQEAAEGAAPHLTDHIMGKTQFLHKQIEEAFSKQLETVLKKMNWPTLGMSVPLALEADFREGIRKLLDLQKPELESKTSQSAKEPPLVLLPLQVMCRSLELAFHYHFDGDKPTNRLDRPEYFLSHITDKLLNQYSDFMADNLQPILLDEFRGTDLAMNAAYIDAISAFITALLPMVRNKIIAILPKVSEQPHLLSHLIHEIMSFDTTIRDDWRYDAGHGDAGWSGLAYEVLATDGWFTTWLNVEKDFALSRYKEIIDAPDSFELDYDSFASGTTKPTKAAIRVNDLLETITDHYKTLTSFSHKLRFLIDIQISIFDMFHERLSDGLVSYLSRTSTIGRTSREDQASLQGVAGLESLCKIYGSSEYLEKAMRDWSDDVFFLELWTELQHRSKSRVHVTSGGLTAAQIASQTSTSLGTDGADESGALFDETAASYMRLRVKCEGFIMELVNNNVRNTLVGYTRINPWATLQVTTSSSQTLPPMADLDALLEILGAHFGFLGKTLGRVPLRKIARSAAQSIDSILFDQVLLRHSFSAAGALQFSSDVKTILSIFEKHVGGGVGQVGLRRISEGAILVGLPIRGSKSGKQDDEEENEDVDGSGKRVLGLWEVEKRMFEATGEEAAGCLSELGLERLGVAEGRKVLARRVELSS
ncbi:hypothetical protein EJ08DRAFT_40332 [Tothia fuscella]|uniref:RINT-1 family protein n=1 Tax=Tothia fuscella TaxID=1048955 RepID=A0A9P4NWT9_9PEZI|nr:hypothetical protein EJ08DRAFT_40332 [Tothia fuscella]